jgi:16S rRNA (cytosine1402-N4)-methyltransferase
METHIPIMIEEVKEFIERYKPQKVLDLTFGSGGHSRILLDLGCNVTAFDRDSSTNQFNIEDEKFTLHIDKFSNFYLYEQDYDLVLADLGMSTMQLTDNRGFSFMRDSSLDMRMDISSDPLWKVLEILNAKEIEGILRRYGEINNANKIVENIEMFRLVSPIKTTLQLRKASGTNNFKVLAQIFQAFRIYINQELHEIEKMLSFLKPKIGVLFLTFHSLEDRLIKSFCKTFKYNGFLLPKENEKKINPKSRSAKLRFAFRENI